MALVGTSTPARLLSPQRQATAITITEAQKQALIDNLQLEVTERARKLRAQYALQAQGLRTRLELRINRIPQSMRKMSMEDFINLKNSRQQKHPPPSSPPHKQHNTAPLPSVARLRGTKRQSDDHPVSSDKENSLPTGPVSNPKKRKPNTMPKSAIPPPSAIPSSSPAITRSVRKPVMVRSQQPDPINILSPKSHNSRPSSRASPAPSPLKSPPRIKSPPPSSYRLPAPASSRPATAPGGSTVKSVAPRPLSRVARPAPSHQVASASQLEGEDQRPTSSSSNDSTSTTIVHSVRKRAGTTTAVPRVAAVAAPKLTKTEPNPVTALPTPAPAPAPAPSKKGTLKSAFHSLTGSKRGKTAAKEAGTPSAPATTGGRVLRKRAA